MHDEIYIIKEGYFMENTTKQQCLRCSGIMQTIGIEKIQLGQSGLLTGIWRNIFAGSLEVEIHICSECGKVEFFSTHSSGDDNLPKRTCPKCGSVHDFDFPKCPICKHEY
jgi:hypothetical protein